MSSLPVQIAPYVKKEGARKLPAPLDYEVIVEALNELDPGQRHFVLTCIESFHVSFQFEITRIIADSLFSIFRAKGCLRSI